MPIFTLLACLLIYSCTHISNSAKPEKESLAVIDKARFVHSIEIPVGYKIVPFYKNGFAQWLGNLSLRLDNTVYLYNGEKKRNQQAQYAVIDMDCGKEDLQQCADAVMRLRAEYLYSQKRFDEIIFFDNNHTSYTWKGGDNRAGFEKYMHKVFSMCGTASLQKQLQPVKENEDIKPGDVFIKGGFPGHAMIVMRVIENDAGHKKFMLAQSYMPAQDIHIVKNPSFVNSPWYDLVSNKAIETPEWTFMPGQLYTW